MFDLVKEQSPDIDAKRTLMIGDRLDTDILFGKQAGVDTLFLTSGVHSIEDIELFHEQVGQPTYVLDSILSFLSS